MKTALKKTKIKINSFIGNKGFTLLEVMISVSIIAIVFVALLKMQSGSVELTSSSKFNNIAVLAARQILTKIEKDIDGWSDFEGSFEDKYKNFTWISKIEEPLLEEVDFIKAENKKKIRKITITIQDDSTQKSFKLICLRVVQ